MLGDRLGEGAVGAVAGCEAVVAERLGLRARNARRVVVDEYVGEAPIKTTSTLMIFRKRMESSVCEDGTCGAISWER